MAYCRECGEEVKETAEICPNCGCLTGVSSHKKANTKSSKSFIIVIICVVFLFLVAFILTNFGVPKKQGVIAVPSNQDKVVDEFYSRYPQSVYNDYNDKRITGTMLKNAYNNFSSAKLAYLVHTKAMMGDVSSYDFAFIIDGLIYVNYGALLSDSFKFSDDMNDRQFSVNNPFMVDSVYNSNSKWNNTNSDEYINSISIFNAELLKNKNGDVVGLIFTEE